MTTPTSPSDATAPIEEVNNPRHYHSHPSGVACIDIIEHYPCNVANGIKYLWRAGLKGDSVEDQIKDLRKAAWYAAREANRVESAARGSAPVVDVTPGEPLTGVCFAFDAPAELVFALDLDNKLRLYTVKTTPPLVQPSLARVGSAIGEDGVVYATSLSRALDLAARAKIGFDSGSQHPDHCARLAAEIRRYLDAWS